MAGRHASRARRGGGITSKLLLPVAWDLAALGLDGLLAVGSRARPFPGSQSAVALVGHAHAPLPLPAVRLALLLPCLSKRRRRLAADSVRVQQDTRGPTHAEPLAQLVTYRQFVSTLKVPS